MILKDLLLPSQRNPLLFGVGNYWFSIPGSDVLEASSCKPSPYPPT